MKTFNETERQKCIRANLKNIVDKSYLHDITIKPCSICKTHTVAIKMTLDSTDRNVQLLNDFINNKKAP